MKQSWRPFALFLLWAALGVRIYHASAPFLIIALLWCFVLGCFYWRLERSDRPEKVRTFYFLSLAFFFLSGLHMRGFQAGGKTDIQPYCHLSLSGNILSIGYQQVEAFLNSTYGRYGFLGLGIFWLLVLFICGGGFCSRVCFFGGWDDAFSRILKKPFLRLPLKTRPREFQLALFLFLAFMSFSRQESEFCLWLCPFKTQGEILDPSSRIYAAQMAAYALVAAVFVVILPILTRKRTFCSTLCPFGALTPLVQKWSPYQVKVDPDSCTSCGLCEAECPSFAIETVKKRTSSAGNKVEETVSSQTALKRKDIYETKITRYCTLCLKCVPACPKGGISVVTAGQKGSAWMDFISLGFGGALSLFYAPQGILAVVNLVQGLIK